MYFTFINNFFFLVPTTAQVLFTIMNLGNDNYFSENCCSCGRAKTLKELRQAENDQELQKISKN